MAPQPPRTRPGLRERKKQATRAALSHAAWTLMREQGLDAVTPESVADIVGVSGRTFRNYFLSREEAIVEAVIHRVAARTEPLRARPAGEPVWDTLCHVLPDATDAMLGDREDVAELLRTAREYPALLAPLLTSIERVKGQLAEAIAERAGTDPQHDLAARLLAAAAGVAVQTSIEVWATGDGSTSLPDTVRNAITQLRAGIPLGNATTRS